MIDGKMKTQTPMDEDARAERCQCKLAAARACGAGATTCDRAADAGLSTGSLAAEPDVQTHWFHNESRPSQEPAGAKLSTHRRTRWRRADRERHTSRDNGRTSAADEHWKSAFLPGGHTAPIVPSACCGHQLQLRLNLQCLAPLRLHGPRLLARRLPPTKQARDAGLARPRRRLNLECDSSFWRLTSTGGTHTHTHTHTHTRVHHPHTQI